MSLSVLTLIQHWGGTLQLRWLSGDPEESEALTQVAECQLDGPLPAPHSLWLIGAAVLEQLGQLDDLPRRQVLGQWFAARPGALLLADQSLCDGLLAYAQHQPTPLLASPLPLATLRTTLRNLLTEPALASTSVHGVFLEVMGLGVLLTGASGIGKSELALELISRGHRLIADDVVELTRLGPETLNGACPELLRDFLEVRGLGALNIRAMFGDPAMKLNKFLRLIIDLQALPGLNLQGDERLQGLRSRRSILGVSVPQITLPVVAGRNLAVLVETAVRDQLLRLRGYNATAELAERQRTAIQLTS